MSASVFGDASRAPLRVGVALVAAAEAVHMAIRVAGAPRAAGGWAAALLSSGAAATAVAAAAIAALAQLARARRPLAYGAVALACLVVLGEATSATLAGPARNYFASGAALAGWVAGLAYARALGAPGAGLADHERVAEAGAAAALAATYVNAGLAKLVRSGFEWADSTTLRSVVLLQHGLPGAAWIEPLHRTVVERPLLGQCLAAGTIFIQLGSFLYLVHPRLRVLWGTLLLGFHLNVLLLTGIHYGAPTALLALFSYPWPRWAAHVRGMPAQAAPERAAAPVPPARLRRVTAIAGIVAAVLLVAAWRSPPALEVAAAPPGEERVLDRLGPFSVGQALPGGFHIAALRVEAARVVVELRHAEGEAVTLELAPARTGQDSGPFGGGTADVLFRRTRLPVDVLLPAGQEIARLLREAAGGGDSGGLLAAWIAARGG